MKRFMGLILFLAAVGLSFGQDGFGDIFGSEEDLDEYPNSIILNGDIGFSYKSYFDNGWESEKIILPDTNLNLLLISDSVEAKVNLTVNADNLDSEITKEDLVNELFLRSFFSFGYLDLGLFKTEWGKGDGIHVLDPLNPLDQSNGISSDINEMKRSELMVKMNLYVGNNGMLELVYKPYFHPIETAPLATDRWNVKDLSVLPNMQTPPDTESPAYSQTAVRLTTALGIFDLGGMYYYGYMTEPGYKFTTTLTGPDPYNPADYTTTTDLTFTRAQLLGLETAWALGPFTFRAEGGYWLTEDSKGEEAHLYNNRAVWLAGFDIMIPGTQFFLSIQEFGSYVLNFDNSDSADVDLGKSYKDNALSNTLLAALEGSLYQDKMKIRLAGLYLFEANGYMILPTYTWKIEDDLELSISGQIFGGDDEGPNPYYAWDDNDNISCSLKYIF
jgi:hypothetical protein